jgi:hypothetical protein
MIVSMPHAKHRQAQPRALAVLRGLQHVLGGQGSRGLMPPGKGVLQ